MSSACIKVMTVVGTLLILAAPGWAQRGPGWGMRGSNNEGMCQILIESLPMQAVDAAEAAGLAYLREEEKLARDVYTRLYEKWGSRIFANISHSEQQHFDALKPPLDRYGFSDPAANNAVGVFRDPGLQALYGDLMAKGEVSLAAALRVGATIEDIDIRDLERALAATDNGDFKAIYENLERGSRNHFRAFLGRLEALGESYEAQYISAASLAEILAAPNMGYGRGGSGQRSAGCCNGSCPLGAAAGSSPGAGPRPSR